MQPSDRLSDALFALLRSGLSERPLMPEEIPAVASLNAGDWGQLAHLAEKQSIRGVIYRAFTHLPKDVHVPGEVVFGMMARAEEISLGNRQKNAVSARLTARFEDAGLTPRIMKGSTVALFYPHPELRESGDIDFFFPKGQVEAACECLTEPYTASDGSIHSREDGIDIDLHDSYFDLPERPKRLPAPGTPEATLLMLSAHILKHAVGTGVGLRQLCDMAMACRGLVGQYDPADLWELFRRTRTLRWNRLLFSFLTQYLGLPETATVVAGMKTSGGRVSTAPLLHIVQEGGHFGHYADTRQAALMKGGFRRKLHTLGRFLRRLPFSLRYAPRTTFSTLWTLLRGNLHHPSFPD